jgi:hypothetical protein
MATARSAHTAALLDNGKVLVAGGENGSGDLDTAEIYDPATGSWTTTGNLYFARKRHTATLLDANRHLIPDPKMYENTDS